MTAATRELARLRYLAAMGHMAYVTRRRLPGARPTLKLALRQAAIPTPAKPLPEVPAAVGARAPASLRGLLDEHRHDPASAGNNLSPATPTTAPGRPVAGSPDVQRFRLAAMVCANRLWLEDLDDGVLAVEQKELVGSIGRALMHPELCDDPRVMQFDWPMHGNQQLELSGDEASASLQGFLARQLDDQRCVELICLGVQAWGRIRGLGLPCAVRRLPSTRDVLRKPAIKRDIWNELRPR